VRDPFSTPGSPAGFWLRNYDIGLYGTVLTQRISHLYRNRNALRNLWEQPLAAALRTVSTDNRPVFFVEMEQDERWRFPDGYDNNLFQWNLYASGRRGHMKDMESLLNTYAVQDIPLIALNLPIDFGKSVYTQDTDDVNLFRQQLKSVASRSTAFVDYQADFPVAFSTYDALHTTWHGARLHAFSMVLQLKEHGWVIFPKSSCWTCSGHPTRASARPISMPLTATIRRTPILSGSGAMIRPNPPTPASSCSSWLPFPPAQPTITTSLAGWHGSFASGPNRSSGMQAMTVQPGIWR